MITNIDIGIHKDIDTFTSSSEGSIYHHQYYRRHIEPPKPTIMCISAR